MRVLLFVLGSVWLNSSHLHALTTSLAVADSAEYRCSPDRLPEGLTLADWIGIRAAKETALYSVVPVLNGWLAENPSQQWITTFDDRGFLTEPIAGGWKWGLMLSSYGFGDAQHAVRGSAFRYAEGHRLGYWREGALEEWYVNDQNGLEHGFILTARPKSSTQCGQILSFSLDVRGDLCPMDELGPSTSAIS
ncbi:MAG: hypothetical protein IPL52_08175 [Flavobacteriales bacterium]|nr:hypothetical protein [Flavobacteriales bacterium]